MELGSPWVMIDEARGATELPHAQVGGDVNKVPLGSARSLSAVGHVSVEQVIKPASTLTTCVEITRKEDSRLSSAMLRDRMPGNRDGENVFAAFVGARTHESCCVCFTNVVRY